MCYAYGGKRKERSQLSNAEKPKTTGGGARRRRAAREGEEKKTSLFFSSSPGPPACAPKEQQQPPNNKNTIYALSFRYLNSSIMLCSGGSPTHARKKFSSAARCRLSALTTGAPLGTSGAFVR